MRSDPPTALSVLLTTEGGSGCALRACTLCVYKHPAATDRLYERRAALDANCFGSVSELGLQPPQTWLSAYSSAVCIYLTNLRDISDNLRRFPLMNG